MLSEKITLYSQIGFLIGEIDTTMLDPKIQLKKKSLGAGWVPLGARTKLGPVNLLAEYRIGSRLFIFNYWDRSYDLDRVVINGLESYYTKESQLDNYGDMNGIYFKSFIRFILNYFSYSFYFKWEKNIPIKVKQTI